MNALEESNIEKWLRRTRIQTRRSSSLWISLWKFSERIEEVQNSHHLKPPRTSIGEMSSLLKSNMLDAFGKWRSLVPWSPRHFHSPSISWNFAIYSFPWVQIAANQELITEILISSPLISLSRIQFTCQEFWFEFTFFSIITLIFKADL